MINKVKTELGPDLATPRGECSLLPPFTGIPRSILFDGRVVMPFAPSPADELRQLSRLLAEPAAAGAALPFLRLVDVRRARH